MFLSDCKLSVKASVALWLLAASPLTTTVAMAANENKNESNASLLGVVKGRVTDDSHQILPGAAIIVEGLNTGTTADVNGFYTLSNLRPGDYTLKISYVGYAPREVKVHIAGSNTLERDITLSEGQALKEVTVVGAFAGERRALQMQKSTMGVTNVVSAEQVGRFPDSNIGDALKRINGVNVQYDQGEARFGQVRGTAADLTSVTVNGDRMPSAEGDTRNVQLDLIPADMIQTIELHKVITSDLDGDAIGGEINLVTKSTPNHRVLNATLGTGYNWISEKMGKTLGFTYGDRFFNKKLGMMFAASYQYNPGGSDNTEFEYVKTKKGGIALDKAELRQYYVTRERQSYSAAFDYKFNVNNVISLKGIYNRRNDWENRYRIDYKKLSSNATKQSLVYQTKAGKNGKNARLERQQTFQFSLDGKHQIGILGIDWAGSISQAKEERPEERYIGIKYADKKKGFDLASNIKDAGERQPYLDPDFALPTDDYEQKNWKLDEFNYSNRTITEDEYKVHLYFKLPLGNGGECGRLKFGVKNSAKIKDREGHQFEYSDVDELAKDWTSHMVPQVRSGFMPDAPYPTGSYFVDKHYLGNFDFSKYKGYEVNEEQAANYRAHENIFASFIRYDVDLMKNMGLTVGLRMEKTHLRYGGNLWKVPNEDADNYNDGQGFINPTGNVKNDYTNWLPSVLWKYSPVKDLNLRASFTETLSRPKYSDLVPNISYNTADEEASIGNPELKPVRSFNYDLSAEYYFPSVGLISAGVFFKDLRDVNVDEVWRNTDATNVNGMNIPADYLVTRPSNAYDARIFGAEFAFERDFGFIAPALKCIGFYGTYTYSHSKTRNYKFAYRQVADGEKINMQGTPEHTANASLYFKKWGVNMRLSYNYAASFLDEMGEVAELDRYYDHTNYLDLNASYTFPVAKDSHSKCTVFAEATNLLNQPLRYYQGHRNRTMQVEYYGVRFNCGVKFNL